MTAARAAAEVPDAVSHGEPPRLLMAAFLPYLLLAPSVLLLLAVSIYPLLYSARISLFTWRFGKEQDFIGVGNYSMLLGDDKFWTSILITATFTLFAVSAEFLLGLGLALLLSGEMRLRSLFRTAFVLPMVVTPVVVGIVWRLLYLTDIGVVSFLSKALFGNGLNFLGTPELALPAVVVMDIWEWTPFMFLILLAGLQSLPLEPFEAVRVDGASALQTFRDLTLPMLRPVILVALLIRTMDAFTIFDQVFILTLGGPGTSTEVMSLFVYKTAFKFSLLGNAAAMIFVVLVIVMAISQIYIRLLRESNPSN